MMERQEVVDFILSEVKRLNEEEHIHDLNKAGRYEELSRVECKISNAVNQFLTGNDKFKLEENEIPEGGYLAVAIWINTVGFADMISDEDTFVDKLVVEAGTLGESIAYKVKVYGMEISDIYWEEFFDDSDADKYEEEYGH